MEAFLWPSKYAACVDKCKLIGRMSAWTCIICKILFLLAKTTARKVKKVLSVQSWWQARRRNSSFILFTNSQWNYTSLSLVFMADEPRHSSYLAWTQELNVRATQANRVRHRHFSWFKQEHVGKQWPEQNCPAGSQMAWREMVLGLHPETEWCINIYWELWGGKWLRWFSFIMWMTILIGEM